MRAGDSTSNVDTQQDSQAPANVDREKVAMRVLGQRHVAAPSTG
jgi:hypothetical protein